jgi:hypothetical protein
LVASLLRPLNNPRPRPGPRRYMHVCEAALVGKDVEIHASKLPGGELDADGETWQVVKIVLIRSSEEGEGIEVVINTTADDEDSEENTTTLSLSDLGPTFGKIMYDAANPPEAGLARKLTLGLQSMGEADVVNSFELVFKGPRMLEVLKAEYQKAMANFVVTVGMKKYKFTVLGAEHLLGVTGISVWVKPTGQSRPAITKKITGLFAKL